MRNLFIIPVICFLASCGVSQNEYDAILKENAELKELLESNQYIDFAGYKVEEFDIDDYKNADKDFSSRRSGKISRNQAKKKIQAYKVWRDLSDNGRIDTSLVWTKQIYGFHFTWAELRDFIREVRTLNSTRPDSLKINGLRVYLGANAVLNDPSVLFVPDAVLMPTIKDKENLYDVDPDYPKFLKSFSSTKELLDTLTVESANPSDNIFNTSLPCPHECN